MLVMPLGSVGIEHAHIGAPLILLVGKWFLFWIVGVRLPLAGVRRILRSQLHCARDICDRSDEALPLIRELGVANFASGVVGIASLGMPGFIPPVSLSAAIFYGVAGVRHAAATHPTRMKILR